MQISKFLNTGSFVKLYLTDSLESGLDYAFFKNVTS